MITKHMVFASIITACALTGCTSSQKDQAANHEAPPTHQRSVASQESLNEAAQQQQKMSFNCADVRFFDERFGEQNAGVVVGRGAHLGVVEHNSKKFGFACYQRLSNAGTYQEWETSCFANPDNLATPSYVFHNKHKHFIQFGTDLPPELAALANRTIDCKRNWY